MSELPYRRLGVWKRANGLAIAVVNMAEAGPIGRRYYFRDQICDAALSVPANIAEGNGRSTPLDYASFVDRARGSLFELDNWLLAARQLNYVTVERHEPLEEEIQQISAMLLALANRLRSSSSLRSRTDPHRSA